MDRRCRVVQTAPVAIGVVGRESVLAEIDSLLSVAFVSQRGGVTVWRVQGEGGIGKSTVLREAKRRAFELGYEVLSCAPSASEARWSYAALGDLLSGVGDGWFEVLPEPQRRALMVALLREGDGGVRPARRAVATATATLLSALARDHPLAVAIDDVQWLDAASARAIEFALRRFQQNAVVVLATHRTDIGESSACSVLDAFLAGSGTQITLGPLPVAAVGRLLLDQLGRTLPGPQLRKLTAITRGNPLHAVEVARHLHGGPDATPASVDLYQLVSERFERLSVRTRRSLLRMAAAAQPTTALLARADQDVALSVGILAVDGDRVTFVHPLYASSIYGSASHAERRAAHGQLARQVTQPEERARHLALSIAGQSEQVATTLAGAAHQARTIGALDAASELAVLAAERTPRRDRETWARRSVVAASYLFHAGDVERASDVLDGVLGDAAPGRTRGDALRLMAEIRYHANGFDDAIGLLGEALGQHDADDFQIPTLLASAYVVFSAGSLNAAVQFGDRALVLAERLGDKALIAEALAVVVAGRCFAGGAVAWDGFDRAIQFEDRDREIPIHMRPSVLAAEQLTYRGCLAAADESLSELRSWCVQRGDEGDLGFLLFFVALCRWWQGRYELSIDAADEAAMISRQSGNDAMYGLALIHRGRANAALGRLDEATEDLEGGFALLEATGWAGGLAVARSGLGFLALSGGHPEAAVAALGPLAEAPFADGAWMVLGLALPDLVEALIEVGESERAAGVIDVFTATYPDLDVSWVNVGLARAGAMVAASRGHLDQALELARWASAESAKGEMPLEFARCLLIRGQLERRSRKRAAARSSLDQAAAICQEIGAAQWRERAESELARLGGPVPSGALTPTEARVARLAADGRTNREIATDLFISVRTVETNLSRVYAKLGIRSRAQLFAVLA